MNNIAIIDHKPILFRILKYKIDSIAVLENPLTLRNMYLAVSFLLLSIFIVQCKEHNVKLRIICNP